MAEIERSAGSVEEAIDLALADLGLSEQEAHVEIVQEPRSGFLGIKAQPAIVRVRPLDESTAPSPGQEEGAGAGALDEEHAALVEEFVRGLLEVMEVDADVEVNAERGVTYVDVWALEDGDDLAFLIGKHGHTLDAVQDLVRLYVLRQTGERCRVQVDVEEYRRRQRARLLRTVRETARRVKRSGRPETLPPMNAFERKIVHDAVADIGGLETHSEGQEPNRRVVIAPGPQTTGRGRGPVSRETQP